MQNKQFNIIILLLFSANIFAQDIEYNKFTLSPTSQIGAISSLETDPEENDPNVIKIEEFKPFIPDDSEINTIILAQLGDKRAENKIIQKYYQNLSKLAKKKLNQFNNSFYGDNSIAIEDLEQYALMGLKNALDRYKPQLKVSFKNYAEYTMWRTMERQMHKDLYVKPLTKKNINKIIATIAIFKKKHGRTPSYEEIASALDNKFTPEKIRQLLELYKKSQIRSLNAPIRAGNDSNTPLENFVSDKGTSQSPSDNIEKIEQQQQIKNALNFLSPREIYITKERAKGRTLLDIANELGLTKQRIEIIQHQLINILKISLKFIQNITEADLKKLEKIINLTLKNSSPIMREVIYLLHIKHLTKKQIASMLNITVIDISKFEQQFSKNLSFIIKNILNHNQYKKICAIETKRLLLAFLKEKPEEPIILLEDFITNELKININHNDYLILFKHYTRYFNELDIRIIALNYTQKMNTKEIGDRLNRSQSFITNRLNQIKELIKIKIEIGDITQTSIYSHLKETLLDSINQIPLKKREIFLTLFYDSASLTEVAKTYSINRASVSNIKKEILEILKEELKKERNNNIRITEATSRILTLLELDFENFLKCFIYEIQREEFSNKENGPPTIKDILFKIIKERIKPKMFNYSIKLMADDAASFIDPLYINETNFKIFKMHYLEGITQVKIADLLELPLTKVQASIRYRVETLKRIVNIYNELTFKEISELRNIIAQSIQKMEVRQRQTLIYFIYDNLNYEQIDKLKGITINKRSSQGKFQRTFSNLQKQIMKKTTSEKIKKLFDGDLRNLKYFIKSINQSFPRSHFNIPELVLPKTESKNKKEEGNEETNSNNNNYLHQDSSLEKRFSLSFLEQIANLIKYSDKISDDKDYIELASILNTLNDKQIIMLELLANKELTRKNTRKKLNMMLSLVKKRINYIQKILNAYMDFAEKLTKTERSQLKKTIATTIMELPTTYKTVLIYYYYDNLTLKDISNIFGHSTKSHHKMVKATAMLKVKLFEKIESKTIIKLLQNSENLSFLLSTMTSDIQREYFNISLPQKIKISSNYTPEKIYKNISSDDITSIYSSLMNSINDLSLNDKKIIIAIFHDKLSFSDIEDIFNINFNKESLNDILHTLLKALNNNINIFYFKSIFKNNIKNLIFFLDKIESEVPRILFNIPLNPSSKSTPDSRHKDLYSDSTTKEQTEIQEYKNEESEIIDNTNSKKQEDKNKEPDELITYNYIYVIKILSSIDDENVAENSKKLKDLLNNLMKNSHPIFPHPMALYVSKLFSDTIFSELKSNQEILNYFLKIKEKFDLSMRQTSYLYFLITNSGYIHLKPSFTDQIIIDFDSLNMKANNRQKIKQIRNAFSDISKQYSKNKRAYSTTFVSKKYVVEKMRRILGITIQQVVSQPIKFYNLKSLRNIDINEAYSTFLFNLLLNNNLNYSNLKFFSNDAEMTESAKQIGAITIDHNATPYEAFKIISQIHPERSYNFQIADTDNTIKTIITKRKLGYLSLAGFQITLSKEEKEQEEKNLQIQDNEKLFGTYS